MADASLHLTGQELKKFLRDHPNDLVIADFYADWCPHCQSLHPTLEALARAYKPQGVSVVMVNTDEEEQTALDYGVEVLPTIFLIRDEKILAREVGAKAYSFWESWIKKYKEV
ncbi:redoxin domain-containing protein [bacterium]|nr:redoxin domain-containing protein [bacterium]